MTKYRIRKDGKLDLRYTVGKKLTKKQKAKRLHKLRLRRSYLLGLILGLGLLANFNLLKFTPVEEMKVLSPYAFEPTWNHTITGPKQRVGRKWEGTASWYGMADDECLDCSDNRIMFNGELFDENAMTLAFNRLPMGSKVMVINKENDKQQFAEVTDTGGFEVEPYNKIADLSKGLMKKLDCVNCEVEIREIIND